MKYLLIILILFASCSPQKRANRLFKKAVRIYPEIIQNFDTTIQIVDTTFIKGDTIKTEIKDTVIVKGRVKVVIKDRFLTVTTPNDTIIKTIEKKIQGKAYPVFKDKPFYKEKMFLPSLILLLLCICIGMFLVVAIQIKKQ